MKKQIQGSLLLVLATVIWGSAFISQSAAMEYVGPFTFQGARCFMAVAALFITTLFTDRVHKDGKRFCRRWSNQKLWKAGIFCGIPLFLACNLQQVGLTEVDPGKSAFLTTMYIVIVPIISLFRGQKLNFTIPVSVVLSVIGLYFLSCVGVTQIATGDILLLGCALMFAVQITFVDKFAADVDPIRLNMIQSLVCAVLSTVVALILETPSWEGLSQCLLPLIHTGVFSMGLAYTLQIVGQKHLQASVASLIMSMESVFAVLFAWILPPYKTLSEWETIGCIFVFAAVVISQLPSRKK